MKHTECGSEVVVQTRVVETEPRDKEWPRDIRVRVPYCKLCDCVVNIDAVQVSPEDVNDDVTVGELTMGMFRKKPVVIEAVQVSGPDSIPQLLAFLGEDRRNIDYGLNEQTGCGFVTTLEGVMRFNIGDWVIKGVKGEFYPCKPDVFAETYDEVQPWIPFS